MSAKILKFLKIFARVTTGTTWLPEVDGLRFVAIVWVVFFHLQGSFLKKTQIVAGENNLIYRIFIGGDQGVLLFFMISGFILCLPFARHYELGEKKVQLPSYYLRRLIRIEPPYVIACLLIFVLLLVRARYSFSELLPHLGASLIYLHSVIYGETSLINVVFWSLEVEVQFYLLAPVLTWIYFSSRKEIRRAVVVGLIMLLPIIQDTLHGPLTLLLFIQYFLAGFVVCDLYVHGEGKGFRANSLLGVLVLLVMLIVNQHESYLERVVQPAAMALLFLFVLFNRSWKNFFSMPVISVIGGMCYSIYLIHFQIIAAIGDYSMKMSIGNNFYFNLLLQIVVILPVVLALSAVFYRLVEQPFMQIRLSTSGKLS